MFRNGNAPESTRHRKATVVARQRYGFSTGFIAPQPVPASPKVRLLVQAMHETGADWRKCHRIAWRRRRAQGGPVGISRRESLRVVARGCGLSCPASPSRC